MHGQLSRWNQRAVVFNKGAKNSIFPLVTPPFLHGCVYQFSIESVQKQLQQAALSILIGLHGNGNIYSRSLEEFPDQERARAQ